MSFIWRVSTISLVFWSIAGCTDQELCSNTIANKILSPNNSIEAIMVTRNCGATTTQSYTVYLTTTGYQPQDSDIVFKSDKTSQLRIKWTKENELLIQYREARIFQFKNFWSSFNSDTHHQIVSIKEKELSKLTPKGIGEVL